MSKSSILCIIDQPQIRVTGKYIDIIKYHQLIYAPGIPIVPIVLHHGKFEDQQDVMNSVLR